jgi:hypothetical protein
MRNRIILSIFDKKPHCEIFDPTAWDQNRARDVFRMVIITLSAMYASNKAEMQTQTADSFPGKIECFYF